jgi:hypothetical protein
LKLLLRAERIALFHRRDPVFRSRLVQPNYGSIRKRLQLVFDHLTGLRERA